MNDQVNAKALAAQAQPQKVGSQATHIEQSRAIAEVQGALVVAQQRPRDVAKAIGEMEQSCGIEELANKAFFRFNRGGQVSGGSIHLARELARCWGNIDYGIKELSRDDAEGKSEMLAFAWDLETNTRVETTFIVPHYRDKRGGPVRLTDMRDIYENNANMGARRVREMVFGVLPPWYVEQAKNHCSNTIENGGGVPLPQRIKEAITAFDQIGVSKDRLIAKITKDSNEWTAHDIAQLVIIHGSIKRGEVSVEDEFPVAEQDDDIAADLKEQAKSKKTDKKQEEPAHDPETGEINQADEKAQTWTIRDQTGSDMELGSEKAAVNMLIDMVKTVESVDDLNGLKQHNQNAFANVPDLDLAAANRRAELGG